MVTIRSILLFCIFSIMALFVATSSWLGMRAMAQLQEKNVATFHAELLNEGSDGLESAVQQLCAIFENLPPEQKTSDPARALAPFLRPGPSDRHLILDGAGAPLEGHPIDPALQTLVDAGDLPTFFEAARKGGPVDIVADNYADYLRGKADAPGMVRIRAYPDLNIMLGMGRLQDTTAIRLDAFADASAEAFNSLRRSSMGFNLCLIILAMTLVWASVQRFFFRPLARIVGAMSDTTDDDAEAHLTWSRFREYAARVQLVGKEKSDLRAKLEREIEARFQAEEERDALKSHMDRDLKATRHAMQLEAEKGLQDIQAGIMRREARVIHHQLAPGLERALQELPETEENRTARALLDQCLLTLRAFGDGNLKPKLVLRDVALAPWLNEVVSDFQAAHSIAVLSNFHGDTQARIDPDALRRAVEFVMDNAASASPANQNIRVDLAREGEAVEIRIIDGGQGIPEDARRHVFVPFYAIDAQSDGLGLALTRSVVEQHGGSIQLHTESEKGTAVVIRLPAS